MGEGSEHAGRRSRRCRGRDRPSSYDCVPVTTRLLAAFNSSVRQMRHTSLMLCEELGCPSRSLSLPLRCYHWLWDALDRHRTRLPEPHSGPYETSTSFLMLF